MPSNSQPPIPIRAPDSLRSARSADRVLPNEVQASSPSLAVADVYYIIFRHKWEIVLCGLLGLVAAFAFRWLFPLPYQSESKLFIRYVMEGRTPGPSADDAKIQSPDSRGENILSSELEILTSLDLLGEVVDAIGPEKILPKTPTGDIRTMAVMTVSQHLTAEVSPHTSVIRLAFEHRDPQIAQSVLREIIDRYLKKHVEIHRAMGIVGDFLTQETDQLKSRLGQTEAELRKARTKVGVVSIEDARKTFADQFGHLQQDIFNAEAELAEHSATLQANSVKTASGSEGSPSTVAAKLPSDEVIEDYGRVCARLELFGRTEQQLATQFTPESSRVKDIRAQIVGADADKKEFERKFPSLASLRLPQSVPIPSTAPRTVDLAFDSSRVEALQARIKVLHAQLAEVRAQAANVDEMEATIIELRRKKELDETNYRRYAASLEQARIDEALGAGHVSNISEIQSPCPPFRNTMKLRKIMAMLLIGGVGTGLAWAFGFELFLDRTIRRPTDVERKLNLPMFLSIPVVDRTFRRRLEKASVPLISSQSAAKGRTSPKGEIIATTHGVLSASEIADVLMPFHDTLRDRLTAFFESQNLTRKPKLVAVTGLGKNSGVTTTAAGLAKSLSETREGNVLLVDFTSQQGSAHQFFKGNICGIDEMLDTRNNAHVQENLYVVTENSISDRLSRNLPQRFTKLVPKLKASDFDYIIFDMPPVSQISITPRLAGFMDMVLLVLESEKTDLELVQRATALLSQSKTHLGAVLNKTRNYIPRQLNRESFDNN